MKTKNYAEKEARSSTGRNVVLSEHETGILMRTHCPEARMQSSRVAHAIASLMGANSGDEGPNFRQYACLNVFSNSSQKSQGRDKVNNKALPSWYAIVCD